jgi:hypothetical protein
MGSGWGLQPAGHTFFGRSPGSTAPGPDAGCRCHLRRHPHGLRMESGRGLVAVGGAPGAGGAGIRVLQFDGPTQTLTLVDSATYAMGTVYSVSWSPGGDFLAVSGSGFTDGTGYQIAVYSFDGVVLSLVETFDHAGSPVQSVAWHPGESYLARCGISLGVVATRSTVSRHDGSRLSDDRHRARDLSGIGMGPRRHPHPRSDWDSCTGRPACGDCRCRHQAFRVNPCVKVTAPKTARVDA